MDLNLILQLRSAEFDEREERVALSPQTGFISRCPNDFFSTLNWCHLLVRKFEQLTLFCVRPKIRKREIDLFHKSYLFYNLRFSNNKNIIMPADYIELCIFFSDLNSNSKYPREIMKQIIILVIMQLMS